MSTDGILFADDRADANRFSVVAGEDVCALTFAILWLHVAALFLCQTVEKFSFG